MATLVNERDWGQFHNPKNLSMNTAIEAAELMEKFVWVNSNESHDIYIQKKGDIDNEIADIFITLFCLCNKLDIDITTIILNKLEKIKLKYPIEKAKGKNLK